jgi:3-oxoacyl-[acyl-carrier-protein] synthase-1
MSRLALTGLTAVSALGRGVEAHAAALRTRQGGLQPNDFEAATGGWIGRVPGLEAHRLPGHLQEYDCRNNRLADLALRTDGFLDVLAAAVRRYGAGRIAVVLGTSTAGVLSAEEAYRNRDAEGALPAGFSFRGTQEIASVGHYVQAALGLAGPVSVVSTACASTARSMMDAAALIRAGVCDAAVVGGADTLCRMTLHGFASLELISPGPTQPCAADRTGISIGEAAGFALLEPADGPDDLMLLGWGASSDGYHMSSPHPEGAGAIAAMRQALAVAGLEPGQLDWVHLHGTGTRANDAAEDLAVAAVLDGADVPVSSTKGWTGHTLGASGVLGAVVAACCIREGYAAGCLGLNAPDPAFRCRVLVRNEARPVRRVLANAFGFGGTNCSLVFGSA